MKPHTPPSVAGLGAPPLPPDGPEPPRETYVLEIHRMTASIPLKFTPGREVAAVLSWKPSGRGTEEWDVTFLTRVTG